MTVLDTQHTGGPTMRGTHAHEYSTDHNLVAFRVAGRSIVMDLDAWCVLASALPLAVWTATAHRGRTVPVLDSQDHGRMMAARLVAGATDQQEVGQKDGDAFNLCRSNLVLSPSLRRVRRRVPLPDLGLSQTTATA